MTEYSAKINGKKEIDEYLDRFKGTPPHEILYYMGKLRDFFNKHMTPEGRRIFKSRLETSVEYSDKEQSD